MDYSKFLAREFLVSVALIAVASVALFKGITDFITWAGAVGGFATLYMGTKITKEVKLEGIKANGKSNP